MKYFEKIAISFGATRKLLKDLKAKGVPMRRVTSGMSELGVANTLDEWEQAPSFVINVLRGSSPRSELFHEYGHLLDDNINSVKTVGDLVELSQMITKEQRSNRVLMEFEANKNALNFMKKNNVSDELIKHYETSLQPGISSYKTYANPKPAGLFSKLFQLTPALKKANGDINFFNKNYKSILRNVAKTDKQYARAFKDFNYKNQDLLKRNVFGE
jgi:hypothetical protein